MAKYNLNGLETMVRRNEQKYLVQNIFTKCFLFIRGSEHNQTGSIPRLHGTSMPRTYIQDKPFSEGNEGRRGLGIMGR
jgi:hypothetical protein